MERLRGVREGMNDYRPIACGAYDELEVLAMHRSTVDLEYTDGQGVQQLLHGRALDTRIHDGAEFLVLETAAGRQEVRLDRILRIVDCVTRAEWRPKSGG